MVDVQFTAFRQSLAPRDRAVLDQLADALCGAEFRHGGGPMDDRWVRWLKQAAPVLGEAECQALAAYAMMRSVSGASSPPGAASSGKGSGPSAGSTPAGGSPAIGAAAGGGGGQDQLLNATKRMQETQMSFNLQYLQLQSQMQHENRSYTAVSNIMKTKHDTVKNSISNVR